MQEKSEITYKEFEKELKNFLDKMDNNQLRKFFTILSARNIIYFSDNFFDYKDTLKCLNKLFITLGQNFAIFINGINYDKFQNKINPISFRSKFSDCGSVANFLFKQNLMSFIDYDNNDYIMDFKTSKCIFDLENEYKSPLEFNRYSNRELDQILTPIIERDRERELERNREIKNLLEPDRAFESILNKIIMSTREFITKYSLRSKNIFNHSLNFDLVRTLDRIFDLKRRREFRETILNDAQMILQKDLNKLHIHSENYKIDFEKFLLNLRKCKAGYWAEWFEEIYKNNFNLTENQVEELLSLTEAQFDLTIAETSVLLFEMRKDTTFFNETRLILLGDKGSGKTSFARRFQKLDADMPLGKESTPGVDFHPVYASEINPEYIGEKDFKINIWDFAGHAVTHAAHKFFLSDRAVYVIVINTRAEDNENNEKTRIDEWLEHITYYADTSIGGKIKIYILINQSDENMPLIEHDYKYDKIFDIEKKCVINLKENNEPHGLLDNFRNKIVDYMINYQKKDIASSIFKIKQDIEEEFAGDSTVSKSKIHDIVDKHMSGADIDVILRILHSYGICFYYDKLEGDDGKVLNTETVVLNPRWITYAIYRLINYISNDTKRKDGHIYESEYNNAFNNEKISLDSYLKHTQELQISEVRHPFISALAETFQLAYRKEDFLIFPICLPKSYPDNKSGLGKPDKNDFFMEITTSKRDTISPVAFPKDIIPAFIVKRHKNLDHIGKKAYCSRNGAVLKRNGIKAEVKKTENSKIVVLVKNNNQNSCEFGAELLSDLYNIIQKYKVFQDEQTKPAVKICFTDKKGREKNCEIIEILEEDSLIESIVSPTAWQSLKNIAIEIGRKMNFRFAFKGNLGPLETEAELEIGNKKDS